MIGSEKPIMRDETLKEKTLRVVLKSAEFGSIDYVASPKPSPAQAVCSQSSSFGFLLGINVQMDSCNLQPFPFTARYSYKPAK